LKKWEEENVVDEIITQFAFNVRGKSIHTSHTSVYTGSGCKGEKE